MDITKLKYAKETHETPLREVRHEQQPVAEVIGDNASPAKGIPQYEKADGTLSASLIVVISGGTVREKNFFRAIKPPHFRYTKIIFKSKDNQGWSPLQMEAFWNECKATKTIEDQDGQNVGIADIDNVFLVTDVDSFEDQLKTVLGRKDDTDGSQWIISNPCFEIWLYYCHRNDPEHDLADIRNDVEHKRSSHLKTLNGQLVEGGMNPTISIYGIKEGISRSLQHYAEDENGIPVLFATQMHLLAQCLIDTMNKRGSEFDLFMAQSAKSIETWKSKIRS